MNDYTMKRCSKCGKEKPATTEYFVRDKQKLDGLHPMCKDCRHTPEYRAKRRELSKIRCSKDREQYNAAMREYRKNNPEIIKEHKRREYLKNREKHIANKHRYYAENRESILKKDRDYRQKHRARNLAYNQAYRRANPFVHRTAKLRRLARKRGLPDTFTKHHWQRCLEYWHNTCAVCGHQLRDLFGNVEPHADHWIPLSNSDCPGTIPENMICLCNNCNETKQAKIPEIWLTNTFGKRKAGAILARVHAYFEWVKQQE